MLVFVPYLPRRPEELLALVADGRQGVGGGDAGLETPPRGSVLEPGKTLLALTHL